VRRQLIAASFLFVGMMGFAMPTDEMPPNTIKLSDMMRQLSARPGFTEAFLAQIQGTHNKAGAALLTPSLVDHLRDLIVGKDWHGLDRFPGWTMAEINPTVRVIGHVAGKDERVDSAATPGGVPPTLATEAAYIDLGEYEHPHEVTQYDLAKGPGFSLTDYVASLGDGVTRGDGPNPALAPLHAQSQNLANALNAMSLADPGTAEPFVLVIGGQNIEKPQDIIAALMKTGHTLTITDTRYFANFGHLHFNGPSGNQDVMMPFWLNTRIAVPNTRPQRPLLVPVSHAEYQWHIRGPLLNADVSFYFGIDGKAEFRTMDQLDQAWVMKRDAHTYTGADAVEVTRLAGLIVQTYAHLHAAHPTIPFGGYYAFGVCQDVVAAIEMKMTGATTLFPNTADDSFFTDPRDAEINALIKRLPKDRDGKPPDAVRIFGSLPIGSSDAELATVSIPGLGSDLIAVHDAWTQGKLEHVGERRRMRNWLYGLGALLALGLVWVLRHKAQRR
jgi:hypothetical protein